MTNFQKSALQTQYPLSPRKFWKKLIQKCLSIFIFWLICGFLLTLGVFAPLWMAGNSSIVITFYIIFAISFLFILIINAIYIKAYIKRYYYDVTESFITIKKRVFTPAEIHVQYGKIQDVYVDQDLLDRMMGLYDVHIASATVTSGIEAHIDGVDQISAEGLKTLLLNKISGQTQPLVDQTNSIPQAEPSITFQSGEDVSSDTYPISSRWLLSSFLSGLLVSIFISFLFSFLIIAKSKRSFEWGPFLLVVITIFAATFIWRIFYLIMWKKNFRFKFMPNFIYTHSSVISKIDRQLPYTSIQDVTVEQGLFNRFFGLCEIKITNASQQSIKNEPTMFLSGQTIENGNKLAILLKNIILSADRSKTGL